MRPQAPRTQYRRIGVTAAREILGRGEVMVLDVRDTASYQRGRIDGARHVSQDTVQEFLTRTPRATAVLIYCYHGNASRMYAQIFSDCGFQEVYSLDGGYDSWNGTPEHAASPLSENLRRWLEAQKFPPHDIHAVAGNKTTPLMKAARTGNAAIAAELLRAGARIETRNADGNNALWLACVGENLDAVAMLINAGIDINNRNDNGATCLMYAASTGKAAVLEMLLVAGADPAHTTLDGFTALDMASTADCLRLLRAAVCAA
jgi:thiosulfate/3-mercaptopyruvate sulfurtransferase